MSKLTTKKSLIVGGGTILLLVLLAIGLIFAPFLNLKFAVFKNAPWTSQNEVVVTKFDLFKPKLTILQKLGDNSIRVIISDYERDSIFTFRDTGYNNGVKKLDGSGAIDAEILNKSLDEAKKIFPK
jgi:hypothetical protein